MVIISKSTLREFAELHADAEGPLFNWYELTANADWKNFNEVRNTFNSVDAVGNDRYVFNIKGNNYRLIALIIFKVRTVFILFIGTHAEYDKIDAAKVSFKK
ncbi:type II toxin-antitoxin system HigB family toxin [uncultured Mucilaginibacter sp.]|uniref:type II toxin-antitoxin system HigB family toxin n=1 Tax=uncultured Mucilaginibacter sp. TaxID=797541 RepID=UPI0025D7C96D|nr:type II toxin-antitoxin system HigB family toxin [uncultured Mucilaginibacter sp.]